MSHQEPGRNVVARVERDAEELAGVAHDGRTPRLTTVRLQSQDVVIGNVRPWRRPVVRGGGRIWDDVAGDDEPVAHHQEQRRTPVRSVVDPDGHRGEFGLPDDSCRAGTGTAFH